MRFSSASALENYTFLKASEADSQGFQPSQQVVIRAPAGQSLRLGDRFRFGESRSLGVQIDRGVLLGRIEALVPHPMGDGAEIDPGLEQVHGGGVANTVGMDALVLERRQHGGGPGHVPLQNEARAESCERRTPVIPKQSLRHRRIQPAVREVLLEQTGRLWPERTDALASLIESFR